MATKRLKLKELKNHLRKVAEEVEDFTPFFNSVIPLIHNQTMSRFGSGGPGWVPLSPSTIASRIRKGTWRVGVGSDQPILQEEGDLRRSVMMMDAGAGVDHVEIVTPHKLVYGTNMKKAKYLQGDVTGKMKAKKIPPRPFLYFDNDSEMLILGVAKGFLQSAVNKGFR